MDKKQNENAASEPEKLPLPEDMLTLCNGAAPPEGLRMPKDRVIDYGNGAEPDDAQKEQPQRGEGLPLDGLEQTANGAATAATAATQEAHAPHPIGPLSTRLESTKQGIKSNLSNLRILFTEHPEWQGTLRYNQFRERVVLRGPPWAKEEKERDLEDNDVTEAQIWCQQRRIAADSTETMVRALANTARKSSFHPVRSYLAGLAPWDGVERMQALTRYLGAEPSEIHVTFTRLWMISAVARIMKPGCKADHIYALLGSQGKRKSMALRALAGEGFFSDAPFSDVGNKDALMALRGSWIVELEELSRLMGKDAGVFKAFLSRQEDRYRNPYGQIDKIYRREFVFCATDNHEKLLTDLTGNRRFWIVTVSGPLDVDAIAAHRDQLWSEALHHFQKGEPWWLTDAGLEQEAAALQQAATLENPWEDIVARYVNGGEDGTATRVDVVKTTTEIIEKYREGSGVAASRTTQNKVASALRGLGFTLKTSRHYAGRKVYTREQARGAGPADPEARPGDLGQVF